MINFYRIILIGTALFLGIAFTWVTGSFALALEPDYKHTDIFIYFFMAMILVTPLWLVLLLPKRSVKTIEFFRIFGIIQLVFLIFIFVNGLIHQINRVSFTNFSFVAFILLLSACTIALYILAFKIKPHTNKNREVNSKMD